MAILAQQILDRVREQLIDNDVQQRWSDPELLRFISDGQRTIAAVDPAAAQTVTVFKMVEGTRQQLPADGNMLLSVIRNMGLDGLVPNRAVRLVKRDILDNQDPNWHSATKVTVVYNYIFDPSEQRAFFVYPPSNGLGYIEVNYSFTPAEITTAATAISLPDIYLTPLFDYVMYRAHQKDSDWSAGQAVADAYLKTFTLFVGTKPQSELQDNPNQQVAGYSPQTRGGAK